LFPDFFHDFGQVIYQMLAKILTISELEVQRVFLSFLFICIEYL